jgi:hypothetical protein
MTPSDELRIEMWRLDQFSRMGFEASAIAVLLDWDVEPAEARNLIENGCTHSLALRILRPLDAPSYEEMVSQEIPVAV